MLSFGFVTLFRFSGAATATAPDPAERLPSPSLRRPSSLRSRGRGGAVMETAGLGGALVVEESVPNQDLGDAWDLGAIRCMFAR